VKDTFRNCYKEDKDTAWELFLDSDSEVHASEDEISSHESISDQEETTHIGLTINSFNAVYLKSTGLQKVPLV
jgi:hypothetical protein